MTKFCLTKISGETIYEAPSQLQAQKVASNYLSHHPKDTLRLTWHDRTGEHEIELRIKEGRLVSSR